MVGRWHHEDSLRCDWANPLRRRLSPKIVMELWYETFFRIIEEGKEPEVLTVADFENKPATESDLITVKDFDNQ